MRKSILFIAKFDNVLKGMNTILSKSFNMQVCPPEPAMVEKTLSVMDIDLVLLYISRLPSMILTGLCDKLSEVSIHTPVIVFGTVAECEAFDSISTIAISEYMYRPLAAHDITKKINELFSREAEEQLAGTEDAEQSGPSEQPGPSKQAAPYEQPGPSKQAAPYEQPGPSKQAAPYEQPGPSKQPGQSEQPHAPQPSAKRNMSLADLADSLENDERRCILLVDDDGRILRAIKMLLEKYYRINLANSGRSALAAIERERPDAVLLDYEMPGLDGKQTLELIRQNDQMKNLPVFFLTGVAEKERIREVIHLRPQGYILKSSEQRTIIDTLENFFGAGK